MIPGNIPWSGTTQDRLEPERDGRLASDQSDYRLRGRGGVRDWKEEIVGKRKRKWGGVGGGREEEWVEE